MKKEGVFVVIDGGEGVGTTTISKLLTEEFLPRSLYTHEPGGSQLGEVLRELILSEEGKAADPDTLFALFWAGRRDHLQKVVYPALREGKVVFCDRFDSSTYAYEVVALQGAHLEELFWKTREVFLRERKPDLYLILDVDPHISLERVKSRGKDMTHFDSRELEFHYKVREGFLRFAQLVDNALIIDASLPLETVLSNCLKEIRTFLF